MTTTTTAHTLEKFTNTRWAVKVDGRTVGFVRRKVEQVPARGTFYPCTSDKVVWYGRTLEGDYLPFPTRKAATEYVVAWA